MKITKEIKAALLVIASLLLFIWGYNFLKGKDLLSNYKTFYVEYDNVEGLGKSAAVTINGLVVGKVNDIKFLNESGKILVEIQVETDFPISSSSIASLYEPGLIGGKQIMIIPNFEDKTLAKSGQTLLGESKQGAVASALEKFTPLQEKVEKLVNNADILLSNLNEILDANAKQNIKNSITNLNETMVEFNGASKNLNQIIISNKDKIGNTLTNLDNTSNNFNKLSDSLSKANIGKTVKNLEKTLATIDKILFEIQSGKGTMGKLVKDETMYNNFTKASKELEILLQDVRLNPTRYINVSVFGKKNKPYIAPKEESIIK